LFSSSKCRIVDILYKHISWIQWQKYEHMNKRNTVERHCISHYLDRQQCKVYSPILSSILPIMFCKLSKLWSQYFAELNWLIVPNLLSPMCDMALLNSEREQFAINPYIKLELHLQTVYVYIFKRVNICSEQVLVFALHYNVAQKSIHVEYFSKRLRVSTALKHICRFKILIHIPEISHQRIRGKTGILSPFLVFILSNGGVICYIYVFALCWDLNFFDFFLQYLIGNSRGLS